MLLCVGFSGTTMLVVSVCAGVSGTTMLMVSVVIVDLLGVEKIARSHGLFNVFSGVAGLLATPFSGNVVTSSYSLVTQTQSSSLRCSLNDTTYLSV